MSSQAAARDFQWTTYEKPRAPPPLPSLPPWAAHAQPPLPAAAASRGSQAATPQPVGDATGAWRRPTSYFGAMKRLPTQAAPEQPANDTDMDDEERRGYSTNSLRSMMTDTTQVGTPPPPRHEERETGSRRDWLYHSAAEPPSAATNQREDAPNDDCVAAASDETASTSTALQENDPLESEGGHVNDACGSVVQPLATHDAYFRPWKRHGNHDNNNNNHHSSGDDDNDGEPSIGSNKWKVRALLNPFAKRKPSTKATPVVAVRLPVPERDVALSSPQPQQHAPPHATQHKRPEDDDENPAAPSPAPMPMRGALPRTPPPRRSSVSASRVDSAPPSALHRPRTPEPTSIMPSQPRQSRKQVRSREAVVLPQLSAMATEPPRFDRTVDLPPALANLSDLRKSTAQLTPLDATDLPRGGSRGKALSLQAPHHADNDDDDDDDNVARVLKNVPPKPPTQLQQLKQQHKQATQKPKKGATLDALKEIQRKRDERRNAQAEEKQRMKTELAQHGDDAGYKFRRLIQKFRDALPASQRVKPATATATTTTTTTTTSASNQRLCVFVRKRPLAKKELKAKGYDILTCLFATAGATGSATGSATHDKKALPLDTSLQRELLCHEPKLKVDCSESLENHAFHFDGVFDDDQSNENVYRSTVGPLVPTLVASPGANLTVFAYGQTGSGKTYTMKAIYRQAAADLFARLAATGHNVAVGVSFYEIYMNQVNDLLNLRKRVQLMEDGDGVVQLLGLQEIAIASADELMELIRMGENARATSANAVHDDSSRSHALLRVTITNATGGAVLARLSMVDLAGSERACDTQSDAKNTRMEGAEINKSLLALKECIRALDRGATHIPFRQSKLTQLLRDSFLCANSKTVMIATVSPCSESCNHTLNTLRYADRLKEIGAN